MSNPDDKELFASLGDLDWDSALDDWETKFEPEVAKDKAESTTAVAAAVAPKTSSSAPPEAASPGAVAKDSASLVAATGQGTVIAPVPRELRDDAPRDSALSAPPEAPATASARPAPPPAPSTPRGGLGQLFSKAPPPPRPAPPRSLSSETTKAAPEVHRIADSDPDIEPTAIYKGAKVASITKMAADALAAARARRESDAPAVPVASVTPGASRPPIDFDDEPTNLSRKKITADEVDALLARSAPPPPLAPAPTLERRSQIASQRPSAPPEPEPERPSVSEAPSRWLDAKKATAYRVRAAWLEEEARAMSDTTDRARTLLAVSELLALAGENDRALAFAVEARDLAPGLPLAWVQTRQLMPMAEPERAIQQLDAEASRALTPAARVHATLLAADFCRLHGHGDGAVARWSSASKLDPSDPRAPVARAALSLARQEHTSGTLILAENSELAKLDNAVVTALRLRGVDRPAASGDAMTTPINDGLRRARTALAASDVVAASTALLELGADPELAKAAQWLSAAFGSQQIASRVASARASKALAADGDPLARRQLAARGIELADPELVTAALGTEGADAADVDATFDPAERAVILALAGLDTAPALGALDDSPELAPLADALAAVAMTAAPADSGEPSEAALAAQKLRCKRAAGSPASRALTTLGRVLASKPDAAAIDAALAPIPSPEPPSVTGVALEAAVLGKRFDEVSEMLSSLPSDDADATKAERHIAAALVAERAGDTAGAKRAWREASTDTAFDGIVRIAARAGADLDLPAELTRIAEELGDVPTAAVLRLEALARSESASDDDRAPILERIHRADPSLGVGAFLAERVARRKGDLDEVLRWIHERRPVATDPLERALDAVREALLVADRDAALASTRLEEAHLARPDDVALRELHERLATEPLTDRGTWRERRAAKASGSARAELLIEAAFEHERANDADSALLTVRRASDAGETVLSKLILERCEIATGTPQRLVDELLEVAKAADDPTARVEAYERLAELDAYAKNDQAAALGWYVAALDEREGYKPSLRRLEHAMAKGGRDEELAPIAEKIAKALDGGSPGEVTAHAQLAARMRARGESGWDRAGEMVRLAAKQAEPSLWSIRALNAHARVDKDDWAILKTTVQLLERTERSLERAALMLRSSEASSRLEQLDDARASLESAVKEDPADLVSWGIAANVRKRAGDVRGAAEAYENVARTSAVPTHRLVAWSDAARLWQNDVKDLDRAMAALEHATRIDATYGDVFARLSALYTDKGLDADLARLLERRLEKTEDEEERVNLEVELARALAAMGDVTRAKASLADAIEKRPDHTTALGAMAELASKEGDWDAAEQAYVRLARLITVPDEQRAVFEKLGEIYAVHAPNLARAEVAFKEVLKRAPKHVPTLERLVEIYTRQGNVAGALSAQQEVIGESNDPHARLARLIQLASIHETVGKDARKAEQVLDSARKEFPTSVIALRAMAEFYARQRQMPAMQILLDRAASDARRAFSQGRFVPALFEVLHAAYELRGRKDAARVVAATLAAVEGQPAGPVPLVGAEARALDPRLDDVLAPEIMSNALRALLIRAGDALDVAAPFDLRSVRAAPLVPGTPVGATIGAIATVVGLGSLQVFVSSELGSLAIPLSSNPPALLVGDGLVTTRNERARAFVVVRALKMVLTRSSALLRGKFEDVAVLVNGLFTAFNPSFNAPGVDPKKVADAARRMVPALQRNFDPTLGVIALEAAGTLGPQSIHVAPAAAALANRTALLAIGDPAAALDGIAWTKGLEAAPKAPEERATWIARTPEARDLMTYSVTDAYAEARTRLGLDR